MIDLYREMTGFRDFARVTYKTEAGDICHRVNTECERNFRSAPIQLQHRGNCRFDVFCLSLAIFDGRRDQTRAERLGENESITYLRTIVLLDVFWIDNSGYGVAEFDFFITNSVAA